VNPVDVQIPVHVRDGDAVKPTETPNSGRFRYSPLRSHRYNRAGPRFVASPLDPRAPRPSISRRAAILGGSCRTGYFQMNRWMLSIACVSAMTVTACHKKPADPAGANEAAANVATPAVAAPSAEVAVEPVAAPAAPFDMGKVAVSTVKLGSFPYLSLPTGYEPRSEKTLDIARYPVWVGDHFQWVEGKVYDAGIHNAEGKDYSRYELQKNIEALVALAGGVKIAEGNVPDESQKTIQDARQTFDDSVSSIGSQPVETFLIHQKDRDIWIQFTTTDGYGAWGIVEAKPFVATAKLLP
jgi:OOP family OmpA-OmpF porin